MTDYRYGVFLRPDANTCWNITQITFALERQFDLISAGSFPPHATLVGNVSLPAGPHDVVEALDDVFAATEPFPVYNSGLVRKRGYQYDINLNKNGDGINEPLNEVATRVKKAVVPLSVPVTDFQVVPVSDYEFAGHMGLASHELIVDPRLTDEVGEYISELRIAPPPSCFVARWYSLYELDADWTGPWWRKMTWRQLKSWRVT